MECRNELISARKARLNAQIIGKCATETLKLISRESLLDTLQTLYDECNSEILLKNDPNIAKFCDKFKETINQLKKARVNVQDFEILEVIGRGHFGEVHVVKEKTTGEVYAMKTTKKSDGNDFEAERDIMAKTQSQFLTNLQYAFQDQTYLFYVMEFHPGGDLLALLYRQGGTLPESAVTFYLAELVVALADLHKMGYVHRDIKPDNVLLDRCGHLKLVDFGSAARLNCKGLVTIGAPVGTPDYVAPEVLKSLENKSNNSYGTSCDYWSLGVLAYELTIGKAPFTGNNTPATFAKIMGHTQHLRFPPDVCLTQGFVNFIKCLLTDVKKRLDGSTIRKHSVFKSVQFDSLRDQVPPFVPKLAAPEDTSNFSDVPPKTNVPSMENFKKKTQFSGRNLPFIGFTFMQDFVGDSASISPESRSKEGALKALRKEVEEMKQRGEKMLELEIGKSALEEKLEEKGKKLETLEEIRDKLERELATTVGECTALKRTLEIERKDRSELEKKALDLIKSAKIKWESAERTKYDSLNLEIEQQKTKITQLSKTNEMLNEQLSKAFRSENKHKESLEKVENLRRRSVIGLESRLEKITTENKDALVTMKSLLAENNREKKTLEHEVRRLRTNETALLEKLKSAEKNYDNIREKVEEAEKIIKQLGIKVNDLEGETRTAEQLKTQLSRLEKELQVNILHGKDLEKRNSLLQKQLQQIDVYAAEIEQLKTSKLALERAVNELETKLAENENKHASLRNQLESATVEEGEQLKELRMKQWKVEKELSNCKIDKRILERELKDANNQVKTMQKEIEKLKSNIELLKKRHETSLLELSSINESLTLDLVRTKESYKTLEVRLESEKEKSLDEKNVIGELKNQIKRKDEAMDVLKNDLAGCRKEIEMFQVQKKNFDTEKNDLHKTVAELKRAKEKLEEELENSKKMHRDLHLNLEALREACVLLENQIIEYEHLNALIEEEKKTLSQNTEKLIGDVCKAREETQEAKKSLNEEKSLRLLAETKIKRLKEDVESLEKESNCYKVQCAQFRQCSNNLSEELTQAEEKITELQSDVKSYERQNENLTSDLNMLKEELCRSLTKLSALKDANYKYRAQLEELKSTKEDLVDKLSELERKYDSKIHYYEEREWKREATIKQQTKLIDYLQFKIEENNNKKKSFADKLFGYSKKENEPPFNHHNHNNKDLVNELQREKELTRALKKQLQELQNRSSGSKLQKQSNDKNATEVRSDAGEAILEGWLKVLSKNKTWDSRYAQLNQFCLKIFDKPEKQGGNILETIDLKPRTNGKRRLILEPLVSEIGTTVANSDQQFIAMIEADWLTSNFVLMATSTAGRDSWFKALQHVFNEDTNLELITEIPDGFTLNCVLDLGKQLIVFGCDCGLFSHQADGSLTRINGLDDVTNMAVLTNKCIMVARQTLLWCDLNHLINICQSAECARPTLKVQTLFPAFQGFCFLATSQNELFCAATTKQLIVGRYDSDTKLFDCLRILDTAEPTACVLFTEQSLLVGADKVYEVDLATLEAQEFLDQSDLRLSHVLKFHKMRSFPMSIMQVSVNEFLIGFKEAAVFVDAIGRCTREIDIKPNCLPNGYYYIESYLYISHCGGCEIVKMSRNGSNVHNFQCDGLNVVGQNRKGLFVLNRNKLSFLEGKKMGDFDDLDSVTTHSSSTESDRFSFSSSIVQSLDGNLSDSEGSRSDLGRKVTFSQTNL